MSISTVAQDPSGPSGHLPSFAGEGRRLKLAEDGARPVINHNVANTCWTPQLKGLVLQVNSIYNGWRFEDIWLDR